SFKEESKLMVVWAIGVYPVGSEDCEIEMVLFLSIDDEERDPNTQLVFEKNDFTVLEEKLFLKVIMAI
ncbi:5197_t:CDS:1, partial [Cetraspora pellucida]